jgi:YD repeat-containing protein
LKRRRRRTGGGAKTVSYLYSAADLVTQITYPSGRIVIYTRDTTGRITGVTTKQTSAAATVNVATSIVYQPVSNLVQSFLSGNGLSNWHTFTQDYELDLAGVYDGTTKLIERTHTRDHLEVPLRGTDNLNLTNIWDNVSSANNQSFWANPANRLQNADGPWGSKTFYYDGVGNRTFENSTVAGTTTSDQCTYPAASNRIQSIVRNGSTTLRAFTYDGAGNIATDARSGVTFTYTYNNANRLKTVSQSGNLLGSPDHFASLRAAVRGRLYT